MWPRIHASKGRVFCSVLFPHSLALLFGYPIMPCYGARICQDEMQIQKQEMQIRAKTRAKHAEADFKRGRNCSLGKAVNRFVGIAVFMRQRSPTNIVLVHTSTRVRLKWCRARHTLPATTMVLYLAWQAIPCWLRCCLRNVCTCYVSDKVACIEDCYGWIECRK